MNNGANIKYLGADTLIRQAGDKVTTGQSNLTELQRRYAIRKDKIRDARQVLRPGYRAEGYANLYLFNPPIETQDATHVFLDCVFYGVTGVSEGGRGESYETLNVTIETTRIIRPLGEVISRTIPTHRYFYTKQVNAPLRSVKRIILEPIIFSSDDPSSTLLRLLHVRGNWQIIDTVISNYGQYETVIESWKYNVIGRNSVS